MKWLKAWRMSSFWFSKLSVTYITAHSPTLSSLYLRHRIFTYVTWRVTHDSVIHLYSGIEHRLSSVNHLSLKICNPLNFKSQTATAKEYPHVNVLSETTILHDNFVQQGAKNDSWHSWGWISIGAVHSKLYHRPHFTVGRCWNKTPSSTAATMLLWELGKSR